MNIHIGSWIVPTLAMIVALVRALWYVGTKVMGKITFADAKAAKWANADEVTQAAVAFAVLSGALGLSLIAWIIWAIVFLNFAH